MSKKIMSILMLFAVTFCFASGCNKEENTEQEVLVTEEGEIIATINGVNYTANDIYDEMLTTSTSVEYMYEKLEDLLISTIIPVTNTMRSTVVNEVEVWKKEIEEDASANKISYKEALKSALQEEGVETEEELIEKKLFEWQEKIITTEYKKNSKDKYLSGYFSDRSVYHISQIVINTGTNDYYDYFNVEPEEGFFKEIYEVVDALSSGIPFYQVAVEYSDDSSYSNGGDLGMVTLNDSNLPVEVRYALASYSKYIEGMEIDVPDYLNNVYGEGIEVIPQKYIDKLMEEDSYGEYFYENDSTKHINSLPSSFDNSRVYGRNIIFNNLLNSRTFRLIETETSEKAMEIDYARMPKDDVAGFSTKQTKKVLVNDEGNPILVVRSDTGIHFISIKKSPSVGLEELLKYYSTVIDETDDYTTYVEKSIDPTVQETRIAQIDALANEYAILAVKNNSNFNGNEDFIRYDMFMEYLGKSNQGVSFNITNEKVKSLVINFINGKKESVKNEIENNFAEGYETYANNAEHADNPLIVKEIPILKCLDNKSCTYTYADGFKVYGGGE